MRIFVPGGTGFLGSEVCAHLEKLGHEVVRAGRSPSADVRIDIFSVDESGLKCLLDDVKPDLVLNLAGSGLGATSISRMLLHRVNTEWPALLARYILESDDSYLLHVASSTERSHSPEYGFESEYSRSKAEGTARLQPIRTSDPDRISIVTVHNVYGPTQPKTRLVRWLIEQAAEGERVDLTYPGRVRDFIYINDATSALAACVREPERAHGKEIGTGRGTSLRDLAHYVFRNIGGDADLITGGSPDGPDPFSLMVAQEDRLVMPATIDIPRGIHMTVTDLGKESK